MYLVIFFFVLVGGVVKEKWDGVESERRRLGGLM